MLFLRESYNLINVSGGGGVGWKTRSPRGWWGGRKQKKAEKRPLLDEYFPFTKIWG